MNHDRNSVICLIALCIIVCIAWMGDVVKVALVGFACIPLHLNYLLNKSDKIHFVIQSRGVRPGYFVTLSGYGVINRFNLKRRLFAFSANVPFSRYSGKWCFFEEILFSAILFSAILFNAILFSAILVFSGFV